VTTFKIKYGVDFWDELKASTLEINGFKLKMHELPLKIEYISNNRFDSYVVLTGFFLIQESRNLLVAKWDEIQKTEDCIP